MLSGVPLLRLPEAHLKGFGAHRGHDFAVAWSEPANLSGTGGEAETVLCHDVSMIDGTGVIGLRTSMQTMRPWLQAGHSQRETPVRCSTFSR